MSALANTYARFPVEFASGSGCVLIDSEGNEYLDFLSGVAVCNTGHCHPQVVSAIQEPPESRFPLAPVAALITPDAYLP